MAVPAWHLHWLGREVSEVKPWHYLAVQLGAKPLLVRRVEPVVQVDHVYGDYPYQQEPVRAVGAQVVPPRPLRSQHKEPKALVKQVMEPSRDKLNKRHPVPHRHDVY